MAQTALQVVQAGTVALAALLGIVVALVLPGKLELAVQPVAAVAQIAETGML